MGHGFCSKFDIQYSVSRFLYPESRILHPFSSPLAGASPFSFLRGKAAPLPSPGSSAAASPFSYLLTPIS